MAKAPKCRKCGNPHWSTERCPRIGTVSPERASTKVEVAGSNPAPSGQRFLEAPAKVAQSGRAPPSLPKPKGRDRVKYNAYQREYQRKRRAEDRALRLAAGLSRKVAVS